MAKKTAETPAAAFEDLLAEAESLAERMEEGGLSLDASIAAYEKGVDNLRRCAARCGSCGVDAVCESRYFTDSDQKHSGAYSSQGR